MITNRDIGFQLGFPFDGTKWTTRQWNIVHQIRELEEDLYQLNLDYSIDFDESIESLIEVTTNKLYQMYEENELT